jgi:hypothetical protein
MLGGGKVGAVVDAGCEKRVLDAIVEAGARDGVTGKFGDAGFLGLGCRV